MTLLLIKQTKTHLKPRKPIKFNKYIRFHQHLKLEEVLKDKYSLQSSF